MTILEYIRSKVRVSLSDENVEVILLDRGVSDSSTDALSFSLELRELLYADALMLIATSPSSSGGQTHEHGGFVYRIGNEVIQNHDKYTKIAMDIYKKYGDDKYDSESELKWIDNDY